MFLLLMLMAATSALAQSEVTTIVYNHQSGIDTTFPTALKANETFSVKIENTCPTEFDYKMVGVKKEPNKTLLASDGSRAAITTVTLTTVYDPQYSGYQVLIDRKKENPQKCVAAPGSTDPVELREVKLLVTVTQLEWEIGQDAALTLTAWIDRRWTTTPTTVQASATTSATKFKVVRDTEQEDPARANFSTLTHFYHPRRNWGPALGFGLINNSAEYYFGLSRGLGERNKRALNIAAGVVFTPIARLPKDIHQGDLLDDAAKLKDLTQGHAFRPFVAFTATFFKSTAAAPKPVAEPPK